MRDIPPHARPHRVVVSVGTDYHPFDRIVAWVDEWIADLGELAPTVLVQHGFTDASKLADNIDFLLYEDLIAALRSASAVVVHGGPATIFEARAQGHLPICVPRDPRRGEHVDGHQQRFARRLAEDGLVVLAESQGELHERLNEALAGPGRTRDIANEVPALGAMIELEAILDELQLERVSRLRRLAGGALVRARDWRSRARRGSRASHGPVQASGAAGESTREGKPVTPTEQAPP